MDTTIAKHITSTSSGFFLRALTRSTEKPRGRFLKRGRREELGRFDTADLQEAKTLLHKLQG